MNEESKLKIALSKGKILEEELQLLLKCKINVKFSERELKSDYGNLSFWLLKPQDVPIWVESGVVDLGIVGLDILRENAYDVLELMDLGIGKCRLSLACKKELKDKIEKLKEQKVIIATKFPNLTSRFVKDIFPEFEIIHLHGSVELAPIAGLSFIISDLVSTGKTLKENGLVEFKVLEKFSAYLICNRNSFITKYTSIENLILTFSKAIGISINFL